MPYTGPRLKDASSAGSSDTSILTKEGMSIGSGKSSIISTQPTAASMAVTVSLRTRSCVLVMLQIPPETGKLRKPVPL